MVIVNEERNSYELVDLSRLCNEKRMTCADYSSPEQAQQAFNAKLPGTKYLDADGDRQNILMI
jgi:hypothetical protein